MIFSRRSLLTTGPLALLQYLIRRPGPPTTAQIIVTSSIDWPSRVVNQLSVTVPSGLPQGKIASQRITVADRLRQAGVLPAEVADLDFFPVRLQGTGTQAGRVGNKLEIIKVQSGPLSVTIYSAGFIYTVNGQRVDGPEDEIDQTKIDPLVATVELRIHQGMVGIIIL